jgi:hypothetical protein
MPSSVNVKVVDASGAAANAAQEQAQTIIAITIIIVQTVLKALFVFIPFILSIRLD